MIGSTQAAPTAHPATPAAPEVGAPREIVRAGLQRAAARLTAQSIPVPPLEGKLLRPLVAYALVPPARRAELDEAFWSGALAVQMVHEASLLHDDILDGAAERRGRETVAARMGVGHALALGDHYLTAAYRAAAAVGSTAFLTCFIEAVERTVAGEITQNRNAGRRIPPQDYEAVVRGKSGALFGSAACLGGAVTGCGDRARRIELGARLGALYQRVDDLLDYCPEARTGKPPLQDYRQRKWTWVLDLAGAEGFETDEEALLRHLFGLRGDGSSPARAALDALEAERDAIGAEARALAPGDRLLEEVIDGWVHAARAGVSRQEIASGARARHAAAPAAVDPEDELRALARSVGGPSDWPAYFGEHAKTFRFAARLFPARHAQQIAGVYAFCRFTDDLVDEPEEGVDTGRVAQRLARWRELALAAHAGEQTGIALLDHVLGEAGREGVDPSYPAALVDGVGMDLTEVRYPDWESLERYTFGVAGAVGGWITQLFGLRDPALLDQAHALGHGMQLTNILRDVGEDWQRGRIYLPACLLAEHGLTEDAIGRRVDAGAPPPLAWAAAMEELIERAEAYYEEAWPGIRALPSYYRRPVAVAAAAYRGIHEEVRRNGYDNLGRRARTSVSSKLRLGVGGLLRAGA